MAGEEEIRSSDLQGSWCDTLGCHQLASNRMDNLKVEISIKLSINEAKKHYCKA